MYDYIIIGAGSAGCVLANRLSEDPNTSVCIIEAGPKDTNPLIHIPAGYLALVGFNKRINWAFNSEPEPNLNNREIFVPRGKTLGGSSAINGMVYIRGHANDYDHWESLGNNGWGYKDMLPIFKNLENYEPGADAYHGENGPLNIANATYANPMCELFIKAGQELGYPRNDDFSGETQEGIGVFQVTTKEGKRHSAATAFLTPILDRKNLTVMTNTEVVKIILEDKKACGVEVIQNKKVSRLMCNKEVLLCAGSIGSPKTLLLSGIGDKEQLEKHNIPVQHELPGVGENLQDHWHICKIDKSTKTISYGVSLRFALRNLLAPINYFFRKKGLMTSTFIEAGGFIKSDPSEPIPDIQFHFTAGHGEDHGRKVPLGHSYTLHTCILRPKSRGSVRLKSNHISDDPEIRYNILEHPEEIKKLTAGFKIAQKIMAAKAFDNFRKRPVLPDKELSDDKEIEAHIRNKLETVYHPVGTCKMGNDKMAVVNDQLKVHGIEGLRVIDASIMPTLVGGNTNVPTMAIASKGADMILGK